jgi:hypothetical protein
MLKKIRLVWAFVFCLQTAPVLGAECQIVLPPPGTIVGDWVAKLREHKELTPRQLGEALWEVVEYTPMGCSDVSGEIGYDSFVIRHVAAEGCLRVRIGIVPPDAPPDRVPTPLTCGPAKNSPGWACYLYQ